MQPERTASERLGALAERAWDAAMSASPVCATASGDHRFDDRLDDLSPEGAARDRAAMAGVRQDVAAVPAEDLAPADRVTRTALLAFCDGELESLDRRSAGWEIDPLSMPGVELPNVATVHAVETPGQAGVMVARWRAMGPYLDQYTANLRSALADSLVAPAVLVRKAVTQLDGLLAQPYDDWALLAPALEDRPEWTEAERSAFVAGLRAAVVGGVAPAFARLRAALADEVLPRARPDDAVGVGHLPGGGERYRRAVLASTSLDLDPDEVHRLGLAELERIDAELAELGGRVLGTGDLAGTLERLRADPALRFTSREEVLAVASASAARADAATADWFGLRPEAGCEVLPVLPHEERGMPPGKYLAPSPDGTRPGRYYVNTSSPGKRVRYDAEALAFHESVPGHHLQLGIAQGLRDLPTFRRLGVVMSYVEGWGLYAERLADEMGLYSGDLDRIGILSFDAWRACRLVVDTGLHALGWSRRQAVEVLAAHTALSAVDIENEVDRYIGWPAQATAYKVGQLELLRLRAEARRRGGSAYDVRAFHDAVLGSGALPLGALREVVETALPGPGPAPGPRPEPVRGPSRAAHG